MLEPRYLSSTEGPWTVNVSKAPSEPAIVELVHGDQRIAGLSRADVVALESFLGALKADPNLPTE